MVVAAGRMKRPVLPTDSCPFCPGVGKTPLDYDVFVYQNDYPSMTLGAPAAPWSQSSETARMHRCSGDSRAEVPGDSDPASALYLKRPSFGACEVILYSPNHTASIYDLPKWHMDKLVDCWRERTRELGSIDGVNYVFIFENRGEAVGVTIHHPHGQIYAFPFVPRKVLLEIDACKEFMNEKGICLFCTMVEEELRLGGRVVAENEHFICIIPYFARFPFEAHLVSRRHLGSVMDLGDEEASAFGEILQALVRGYDHLFGFTSAYIMAFHQAPTDGADYSAYHFHVEFYPAHADSKTQKHLSGTEIGIDVFVNPSDVESNAVSLRRAIESAGT
ncbi:MAG: galactose-1-phosphate uridylyltransferase [Candidatus Coatesbacteria bacterium]|nr:galactose-1-phosphate uridylyltransferase [Candidatus Coatesbacteria bacterium]